MRMLNTPRDDALHALWRRLKLETSAPPPASSWRVRINGHSCGWASPAVAEALLQITSGDAVSQTLDLPADHENLSNIACFLKQQGLLKGWRDELLDVRAPDGQLLGAIERAVMRPLGLTTYAVHLNAYTPDKNFWIARRASHKNTDPGKWDTLVGGLIASGETPKEALLRESNEEAGLLPDHLANIHPRGVFIVRRVVPEGYQVEHTRVTDCVIPAGFTPKNLDGEVEEIRQASREEVLQMIEQGAFTVEAALSILISLGCPPDLQG